MELVVTTRNLSLLLPCLLVHAAKATTAKSNSAIVDSIFFILFSSCFLLLISLIHDTLFRGDEKADEKEKGRC